MQFAEFNAAYVEALRCKDALVEAHFVRYFGELIRLKLRSRLDSAAALEDVCQETFTRVLALIHADALKQPDRLGALVNSVCNNVLKEQYRGHARDRAPVNGKAAESADGAPPAHSMCEREQLARQVQRILTQLPERDQGLVRAVLLEDRDKGDICREWGVTRDHLRVLVHRAKQSFKTFYLLER